MHDAVETIVAVTLLAVEGCCVMQVMRTIFLVKIGTRQASTHLSFAVCIVPVVDKREQQPDAMLGRFIQDIIQSLEGVLAVLACNR